MRQRIRELEDELKRQREQYSRRSSVAPNQNDAELERQRSYIQQLEDELGRLK